MHAGMRGQLLPSVNVPQHPETPGGLLYMSERADGSTVQGTVGLEADQVCSFIIDLVRHAS